MRNSSGITSRVARCTGGSKAVITFLIAARRFSSARVLPTSLTTDVTAPAASSDSAGTFGSKAARLPLRPLAAGATARSETGPPGNAGPAPRGSDEPPNPRLTSEQPITDGPQPLRSSGFGITCPRRGYGVGSVGYIHRRLARLWPFRRLGRARRRCRGGAWGGVFRYYGADSPSPVSRPGWLGASLSPPQTGGKDHGRRAGDGGVGAQARGAG